MTATVIPLSAHRRNPARTCRCAEDFTCYSHRLVDLAARVEDVRADVEQFRFCDWGTFDRLTNDVLGVLQGIAGETLPDETSNEPTGEQP